MNRFAPCPTLADFNRINAEVIASDASLNGRWASAPVTDYLGTMYCLVPPTWPGYDSALVALPEPPPISERTLVSNASTAPLAGLGVGAHNLPCVLPPGATVSSTFIAYTGVVPSNASLRADIVGTGTNIAVRAATTSPNTLGTTAGRTWPGVVGNAPATLRLTVAGNALTAGTVQWIVEYYV
jgi:hypothetical protein